MQPFVDPWRLPRLPVHPLFSCQTFDYVRNVMFLKGFFARLATWKSNNVVSERPRSATDQAGRTATCPPIRPHLRSDERSDMPRMRLPALVFVRDGVCCSKLFGFQQLDAVKTETPEKIRATFI